ncbi:unnamed protein product, partial [Didymodactylos carnosus]
GDDHVFVCEHLSNNTIDMKRKINPGGYVIPLDAPTNSGGTFTITQTKFENSVVTCEFILSNFITNEQGNNGQSTIPTLSQTVQYYPLIAIGYLDNYMEKHSTKQVEIQLVSLNRREKISYNFNISDKNSNLLKAHGCIMIITWIVIVSTGIIVARYFKNIPLMSNTNKNVCGETIWFAVHRGLMSSAAILTILAFLFILIYKQGSWVTYAKNSKEFEHSIIGIIIVCFAFLQPFIALFRCHPGTRYRFIYNYLHAIVGFSAFLLSIVAIFLAVLFPYFNFQSNLCWGILTGWTCWIITIFIMFESNEYFFRINHKLQTFPLSDTATETITFSEEEKAAERTTLRRNLSKEKLKIVLLVLHILVALAFSITLVITIGQISI